MKKRKVFYSQFVDSHKIRRLASHGMECLFCKIAQGKIPSDTLYEDNDTLVFKDIHPKAPVHLLIIPKMHIQSIAHLEENHSDVIVKLIYTAKRIAAEQRLRGYKLVFNVGKEGGQDIDHLHLHVLGGWSNQSNA